MTDDLSTQLVSAMKIDTKIAGVALGRYVIKRLLAMRQSPELRAERALANSIARKHDEDMRQKALEYGIGYRR